MKIQIRTKDWLNALLKTGGEAKITPLYEAFDKTSYQNVESAKLKTALRNKGLELAAENPIIQALHQSGKRTYTFKLKE